MHTPFAADLKSWAQRLSRADRIVLGQVVLWVAAMISLPIVRWTLGESALKDSITVGVLVQAGVILAILARAYGVARGLGVGLSIAVLAWGVEALGVSTGTLFGRYSYSPDLQPQLLNVPVLVPVAWLMMLPPAWALGWLLVRPTHQGEHIAHSRAPLSWVAASAVAFTAWDLFLDPQMVSWDYWQWETTGAHGFGGYFGIPWSNYLGWLLVSGGVTFLAGRVLPPATLPITPLVVVYVITWLLQSIGLIFFWGLPLPGMAGFVGMGLLLGVAVWKARKSPS